MRPYMRMARWVMAMMSLNCGGGDWGFEGKVD